MELFDTIIDRKESHCEKWDKYKGKDVIPMWVADMDFRSPEPIIEALHSRVEHGIFGYSRVDDETTNALIDFIKRHYGWEVKAQWLVWLPGVVSGLNIACKMSDGDIITNTPIYPHFIKAPRNANKEPILVPLVEQNNRWCIDFEALLQAITPTCKLFLLCNPFNPGGTVFTKTELQKLADICEKHKLTICSDEIHADLILNPKAKHIPIASINEYTKQNSITLLAPSKTFNIAGLQSSFAIIPNENLRKNFEHTIGHIASGVNLLAIAATRVAYTSCDDWLASLRVYLAQNLAIVQEFVKRNPQLKLLGQDATFLAWIDARALHVQSPYAFFLRHGVGLSDGGPFGDQNFVRLNFGCPKELLSEGLARMQKALDT